jgi:sulfite exporter TauE/SafE
MCGPLASSVSRTVWQNISYNLGRGLAYVLLGIIFGAAGQVLLSFTNPTVQWIASGALVALMLFVSWRVYTEKPWHISWPKPGMKWQLSFYQATFQKRTSDLFRSLIAGYMTAFLPCGWLYTFAALAAATGSASRGAVVLFAFWLGTLPIMAVTPLLFGHFLETVQRKSPKIAAALIASSAFFTIWIKWGTAVAHASCH